MQLSICALCLLAISLTLQMIVRLRLRMQQAMLKKNKWLCLKHQLWIVQMLLLLLSVLLKRFISNRCRSNRSRKKLCVPVKLKKEKLSKKVRVVSEIKVLN